MTIPVVLIILGLLIGFGAFVFAAINMMRGGTGGDFDSMWRGHIGATIVMALGGLIFIIGLVLAGVDVLSKL